MSAPSSTSSGNKELVRGLYAAFAKGDAGTVMGALDAGIVWNEAENQPYAVGNPYKGPDAILNGIFMPLATEWDGFKVTPVRFTAESNEVLVEGRYTGTYKDTGAAIDAPFVHAWTIENGKIVAFQQYTDTAQWRQVMGPAPASGLNRVVHFEIGAQEPERCGKFFSDVFGWKIMKWEGPQPYWMAMTGPRGGMGINGGILRHQDGAARTVNTIEVASIEETIENVKKAGGQVVVPKMPIPGIGWLAYCTDTEGGLFGIHVSDPTAK